MTNINGAFIVMKKEVKLLFKSKRRIGLLFMVPIMILIAGIIISSTIYFVSDGVPDPTNVWVIDESDGQYSSDLMTLWSSINDTELETINADYQELQAEIAGCC